MTEGLAKILEQIKSIRGARFYFIVILLFIFAMIFLFKEQIGAIVTNVVEPKELKLRHSDTSKIRYVVENVYDSTKCLAYILYLYQPKEPVVKKLEMASTSELENEMRINEFVLKRQTYIQKQLKRSNHVLLDAESPAEGTEKYHRINGIYIPYIYIYGIRGVDDELVGEIHIWYVDKPSEDEMKKVDSKLSETAWYIY